MRFEVPQFIEIEDKIFGPLTWRQFLYLGGGVGMAVVMFITFPFILFILLGLPLALISGALAFYPINNRPFSYFLEAIVNYFKNQQRYQWKKKSDYVHRERPLPATIDSTTYASHPVTGVKKPKKNITSLTRKLELQALQKTE